MPRPAGSPAGPADPRRCETAAAVIGKVCQRGSDVRRLLGYLFREGLAGEHGLSAPHTDAHLIAAWDGVDGLEPPRDDARGCDLGTLAAALNAPLLAAGLGREQWQQARPVYHLAISAAETDRHLSDEEWTDVVAEWVHRIGLAPRVMRRRCGGSRSGTPTTMSMSWRRWPGRTAGGSGRATTSTEPGGQPGRRGPLLADTDLTGGPDG